MVYVYEEDQLAISIPKIERWLSLKRETGGRLWVLQAAGFTVLDIAQKLARPGALRLGWTACRAWRT
jgi:hypothetical protein